jgi:transcription elongation factor GreA
MAVAEEKFILTPKGYAHIEQQLAELEEKEKGEREQITDAVEDSVGRDDSSDMGAEFEWRSRKNWTDEKIAHLRYILERAEVYEDAHPQQIDVGERVTVWSFAEKAEIQFDVVSSAEVTTGANVGPGVMDASDASPMGQALIGKGVGDLIEVETPDGPVRYAVRKIEPIPAT